ncbi:MAG: type IV pili twitching motility protein PilT, partial [Terriglobia bacterium]
METSLDMNIDDLLREAIRANASDLHLKIGNRPSLRVDGELVPLTQCPPISSTEMEAMAIGVMTPRQQQRFQDMTEIDVAYSVEGAGRFRVNVFHETGALGMAV